MAGIGNRTIASMVHMIAGLLENYQKELTEAYLKSEGAFSISIGVKVKPDPKGNNVRATLSFTKEKIQAEAESIVDDEQISLFIGKVAEKEEEPEDTSDDDMIMKIASER
jgi:exoribonuclease II